MLKDNTGGFEVEPLLSALQLADVQFGRTDNSAQTRSKDTGKSNTDNKKAKGDKGKANQVKC